MRDVIRGRVRQQIEHDGPVGRVEDRLRVPELRRRQRRNEEGVARRRRRRGARGTIRLRVAEHEQQHEREHPADYLLYSATG
jgi:hypothetical protein